MAYSNKRKGQSALDLVFLIVAMFMVGITAIFGYKILSDINTDVQADPDVATIAKTELGNTTANYPQYFDNAFVLILAIGWIATILTAFLIDAHPVFFIISWLLVIFALVIGMVMSNAYQDFTADEDITTAADAFPMTNWIMENLLILFIAMGGTSILSLYAKGRL